MSAKEQQEEELEALDAIFEDDESYEKISETEFSYKITPEGESGKNVKIDFKWGENYPEEAPEFGLESFYNTHLTDATKEYILEFLSSQAEENLGDPMIYTLIEGVKDNIDDLTKYQKERPTIVKETVEIKEKKVKEKKEHLTKKQKARATSKLVDGELPRGHDWVSLISHLSQTGAAQS